MDDPSTNGIVDGFAPPDRHSISKNGRMSEGSDSTLLSDLPAFMCTPSPESESVFHCDLTHFAKPDLFDELASDTSRPLTRRFSWPCFFPDECDISPPESAPPLNYGFTEVNRHFFENARREKALSRLRSFDRIKCFSNLRKNTWGSLIYRFRKFCLEHNKNSLVASAQTPASDLTSPVATAADLSNKSAYTPPNGTNNDFVQYAVFKPVNLTTNYKSELVNGFVRSKDDSDDVVLVLKSNNPQKMTNYGLTRIINCTARQEYEVVNHNTGDYFLLKLTSDVKTFRIYETLFDHPHPNLVEVIQLLTNQESAQCDGTREPRPGQIYYILLNIFNCTTLQDYHINTLPSLIDVNLLRSIIKGLLRAIAYLHSRSLVLSKLTMRSVVLYTPHCLENATADDLVAKIVDLDDVRPSGGRVDVHHDIWLVASLLFNFIEGREVETNPGFRSSLWTHSPKMFDFCVIALGKQARFNSATEALIHPWLTSSS